MQLFPLIEMKDLVEDFDKVEAAFNFPPNFQDFDLVAINLTDNKLTLTLDYKENEFANRVALLLNNAQIKKMQILPNISGNACVQGIFIGAEKTNLVFVLNSTSFSSKGAKSDLCVKCDKISVISAERIALMIPNPKY